MSTQRLLSQDKPADPIVFGPEYDPRTDPRSVYRYSALQAADRMVIGTRRDGSPVTALLSGRVGRGKASLAAVIRQIALLGRKEGVSVSSEDPKAESLPGHDT